MSSAGRYLDLYRAEAAELEAMAGSLAAPSDQRFDLLRLLDRTLDRGRWDAQTPRQIEMRLELAGRHLRRRCLQAAHAAADRCWKSPPQAQALRTAAGQAADHGYERELQPLLLEQRLTRAAPPPPGWSADHILFSSGQAALTAILLSSMASPRGGRLSVAHAGGYFETRDLFGLLGGMGVEYRRHDALAEVTGRADLMLLEPVFCADGLHRLDLSALPALLRADPPALLAFDATLAGATFPYRDILERIGADTQVTVACMRSGLKLDQAGLELANVGIVSIYRRERGMALGGALRRIRGLTGGGLTLDEMAALEAPWFLDPDHAARYAQAVFANNAALAQAMPARSEVCTVAGGAPAAPFCVLHLPEVDPQVCRDLEAQIEAAAKARHLLFDRGGSFGFRGHRFEAVVPEPSQGRPFLRIAMGARAGWSRDGIITLMREIASGGEWKRKMREARPAAAG